MCIAPLRLSLGSSCHSVTQVHWHNIQCCCIGVTMLCSVFHVLHASVSIVSGPFSTLQPCMHPTHNGVVQSGIHITNRCIYEDALPEMICGTYHNRKREHTFVWTSGQYMQSLSCIQHVQSQRHAVLLFVPRCASCLWKASRMKLSCLTAPSCTKQQ